MCKCKDTTEPQPPVLGTRETISGLFARGHVDAAARHRLEFCLHASPCRRPCARLVKGPGVAGVKCVDIDTGAAVDLYAAIEDEKASCPEGRW